MGLKTWLEKKKLRRLRGVVALDHGIVKGQGIPLPDRYKQESAVKYWAEMTTQEARDFYLTLPAVTKDHRLRAIEAFRRWNQQRKEILETVEAEFKKQQGIEVRQELSQAERNRLGEFIRQRINQLNDGLAFRI